MNGMSAHEYRGPHPHHDRIEELERQVELLVQENLKLREEIRYLDNLLRTK